MRANGDTLADAWEKFRKYARRVGYGVVPREFVHPLTTMQDHALLTTDPVPQFGALEALRHLDEVDVVHRLYALPGTIRLSYSAAQFENAIDRLAAYFEGKWI